ncbi:MAG: hypothetical protein H7222_04870 [Methylotenera sp.]|nr:hypothetical protein [Oligoflexia bacterium]
MLKILNRSHFLLLSGIAALSLTSSSLFAAGPATPLLPTVKQLVQWETGSNAVANRSAEPIAIEHYEIPLSAMGHSFSENLEADVRDALVFRKNGVETVRWIINPEDTKWHKELETWLKKKGLSVERHHFFTGYLTASRSMILSNPENKAQFSAKVSTDRTGGNWRDKHQGVSDAEQVRMADGYLAEGAPAVDPSGGKVHAQNGQSALKQALFDAQAGVVIFDHFKVLDEPAEFEIEDGLDQAMLVRSLGDLPHGSNYYLPGFSAMHDATGRAIALMNGSTNPEQFWNEHYNKALGRAVAEFNAHYGLTYDSPHSQNFMIELDANFKPTGKIVFRDFGDSYAFKGLFEALGEHEFLKEWEADNILDNPMVAVGILHGNEDPKWITDAIYTQWGHDFFAEYEKTFSALTGVPLSELNRSTMTQNGKYVSKGYNGHSLGFQRYLSIAECFHGKKVTRTGIPCPEHLLRKIVPGAACMNDVKKAGYFRK